MKDGGKKISDAEWLVCQVLWQKAPRTANQVVDALAGKTHWKPRTIKTLLNRLVKKRVLAYHAEGREYRYYPLVTQTEYVRAETRSFIERVFGGTVKPMLAAFLDDQQLSEQELAEIRQLLESKTRGR